MKKCAFLSMDSLDNFVCYDDLLIDPFHNAGWQVETVSWRNGKTDWNDYDVVIIRSCWDYQDDAKRFLEVLKTIEKSSVLLANSLEIVKWNIDKKYLIELEQKGIDIVPSILLKNFDESEIENSFVNFNCTELIIKPTISANADNTFRIKKGDINAFINELRNIFKSLPYIIQPFINSIITEGEYSLFYFGGQFSHCILKTPKENDFRVQEEHGGELKLVEPEELMLECSTNILNKLIELPLYARIDLVRYNNSFALMELELIEPSLYFNMDIKSAQKFTDAFTSWYEQNIPYSYKS